MKGLGYIILVALFLTSCLASAAENCTASKARAVCDDSVVQAKVDWACKLVESKGKAALPEIKAMRYDCCGEADYVWINDTKDKITMIMHPIKTNLDGTDITNTADPKGTKLFADFVKAVKATPSGAWVDYMWTKFAEKNPTPKKSWVKGCKAADSGDLWVVGSGTWK